MGMRAMMLGFLLAASPGAALGVEVELAIPPTDGALRWDAAGRRLSVEVESWPLKKTLAKLGAATGWRVYFDPRADAAVSAQFTNRTAADGLRLLLGSLNFAIVPQKEGPAKLLVFRNSMAEATELVDPAAEALAQGKDWLRKELIISLGKNATRDIDGLARLLGAKVVGRNDKLRTYRLEFDSEEAAAAARTQLAGATDLRVDYNYALRPPEGSGFQPGGGPTPFDLKPRVNADGSHTIVAVVDTAVQPLSPAMSQFLLNAIDVSGAADAATLASEGPLHGTSMVETLLASMARAAEGESGSSVRVLPVNVYGGSQATSTYEVALGIFEAVRNGARVVNLSLGGQSDSAFLNDLIAQARARGVVFYAAAGNAPTAAPTFPAANPLVYAVTAGDAAGNIAPYANHGAFVDLIAPGTSFLNYGGSTYRVTGTSPATAVVSGVVAAYLSQGHTMAEAEARAARLFGIQKVKP